MLYQDNGFSFRCLGRRSYNSPIGFEADLMITSYRKVEIKCLLFPEVPAKELGWQSLWLLAVPLFSKPLVSEFQFIYGISPWIFHFSPVPTTLTFSKLWYCFALVHGYGQGRHMRSEKGFQWYWDFYSLGSQIIPHIAGCMERFFFISESTVRDAKSIERVEY